jgi:hypothetical protein
MITKLVPAKYDLDADCPRWLAFLDRVLAGNGELRDFLQRAIGYSLTGLTSARALFFLYGSAPTGSRPSSRCCARSWLGTRIRPTSRASSSGRATGRGTTSPGCSAHAW